ncbi:MAG: cytochrome c1 [Gammaproteobacteria bacterium]|nr:cytochrome c1 [Gammaproteobacteria bacterium]
MPDKFPRLAASFLLAAMILTPQLSYGAGAGYPLDAALNDVGNIASLQRGARNFVNYCMGCHSAQYVRFNRLANDLQITEDQLVNNLMFAAEKPHETMQVAMPADDSARWFGQAPPDLTLIARSRGTDYLYTFLRTFYVDDSKPTGVNNLVLEGASMPHVLWELQGMQRKVVETDEEGHESIRLETVTEGSMSADEYDQFVRDIVNFLDYTGEPMQLERQRLGYWVLAFLLVFGLFSYLLKSEIWKDVK